MSEQESKNQLNLEIPFDSLSVLNARQLEFNRKKNGNYVLPEDLTILVKGQLRKTPTIIIDIGMRSFTRSFEVQSRGGGTSIVDGLIGKNLGFFKYDLDNLPDNARNIISDNKGLGRRSRSNINSLSDLELFFLLYGEKDGPNLQGLQPENIGSLIITAKLRGYLKFK